MKRMAFSLGLPLLLATFAAAQTTGRLTGTIKAKEGGVLEGATVKISAKDSARIAFTVKTDKKGMYSQIGLTPGVYVIDVAMEGYMPASAEWKVTLGSPTVLDFDMVTMPKMAVAKESPGAKDYKQAVEFYDSGKYEDCIAAVNRAIAAEPESAIFLTRLGLALDKLGKTAEAEAQFLKAVQIDANSYVAWFSIGQARMTQRNYTGAAEAYERATNLNATDPEAFFNLGSARFNDSKIAEAVTAFEKAVQIKPDHLQALYWMATSYVNLGKIPEAKAAYEKFLTIAPATDPNVPQVKMMLDALAKM